MLNVNERGYGFAWINGEQFAVVRMDLAPDEIAAEAQAVADAHTATMPRES